MKIRFILLYLIFLTIAACRNEAEERPYPRVRTLEVANISESGALFRGDMFEPSGIVIDHGFIWSSEAGVDIQTAEIVPLGPLTQPEFSSQVSAALQKGITYYVRAYVKTENFHVFGEEVSFVSMGSQGPVITKIMPSITTWGETISIIGKNFSSKWTSDQILIGDINPPIVRSTKDTVWVQVPFFLNSKFADVFVKVANQLAFVEKGIELLGPSIQSVSPTSGPTGTLVQIGGRYLRGDLAKITIGGIPARIVAANTSSITCEVPPGLSFGSYPLIVTTAPDLFAQIPFQVQGPVITSIEPSTGSIEDQITIRGNNFGANASENTVNIGGSNATVVSGNSTELRVIVPTSISEVRPIISVSYLGSSFQTNDFFAIKAPQIDNISPTLAGSDNQNGFTIQGDFFNPIVPNRVFINDQEAITQVISKTEIFTEFPTEFFLHENPVKVTWQGQQTTSSQTLNSKWIRMEDAPNSFSYSIKLETGNRIFIVEQDFPSPGRIWEFNPANQDWLHLTDYPSTENISLFAFAKDDALYVGGGLVPEFWKFDLTSETWTPLGNLPALTTGLSESFAVGNHVFVIEQIYPMLKFWKYDVDLDVWTDTGISHEIYDSFLNSQGFNVGNIHYLVSPLGIYKFNPGNGDLTYVGLNFDDGGPAFTFQLDGKYFVGGSSGRLYRFDPVNEQLIFDSIFSRENRQIGIAFGSNGLGFLVGGVLGNSIHGLLPTQKSYLYNPSIQ